MKKSKIYAKKPGGAISTFFYLFLFLVTVFLGSSCEVCTTECDDGYFEQPSQDSPKCAWVFPDTTLVSYQLNNLSVAGDSILFFSLEQPEGCPYDLSEVSSKCRCKCSVEFLEFDDPTMEGQAVKIDISGGSGSNSSAVVRIIGGKVDLTSLNNKLEWESSLKIEISQQGKNLNNMTVMGGGLCVVVDVEGGGD